MFNSYHYYLLDNVSETILGSFYAKSDSLAKRYVSGFDFDKARISKLDCSLIKNNDPIHELETYSEVKNHKLCGDVSELLSSNCMEMEKDDA